jgi:hypothetical protein
MIKNIFGLFFVSSLFLLAPASMGNTRGQEPLVSETLLEELAGSLSHLSNFEISTKKDKHFPTKYSFLNKGIKEMQRCSFKSHKSISENSQGKTFLRFKLSIFEYKSAAAAKSALDALLESSDPNIGLSYAWDYVVNVGTKVYWLNAPCLLSKQNWQQLAAQLEKNILKNSQQNNSFECHCGLNCKRN